MSSPYEVITASAGDVRTALARLWANSFEVLRGGLAEKKVERFYLHNPAGSGPVFLLRDTRNATDVGVQALILRRFYTAEQPLFAGTMADYAVDPAHRSLGPALQLLKASIASSKTTLAFVYGLPNRKAEPILRRAGLEPVQQLTRYAAPLKSRPYLAAKLPGPLLSVICPLANLALSAQDWLRELRLGGRLYWRDAHGHAAQIDAIWRESSRDGLLRSDRSAQVLFWRYGLPDTADASADLLQANAAWRIELASVGAKGNAFGYVVWGMRDGIAVVGDFFCEKPHEQSAHLLASFRRRARAFGAASISLEYCGSPMVARGLAAAGFVPRESCPVFAVIHQGLPSADSWYMTAYDRDTE